MKLGCTTMLCAALLVLCGDAMAEAPKRARAAARVEDERARTTTLRRATQMVSSMSLRASRIQRQLREARDKKLAARGRCLDGKLSMAHAVERMGQRELSTLQRLAHAGGPAHERLRAPMARLLSFDTRSRRVEADAHVCGRPVSRRARAKTHYSLKVIRPNLPPLEHVFIEDRASTRRPAPRRKRVRTARK